MSNKNISIVFSSSDEYTKHLGVLLASIIENNKDITFDFYVMNHSITDKSKVILKEFVENKNNQITFLDIDEDLFKNFPQNISYIKRETYYRYMIADLLPKINKTLYLDIDIIVNGSLIDLWNTDIAEYYCAGVKDLWMLKQEHFSTINFSKDDLYVNAGVLLLNLEKIRKDGMVKKLFENTENLKNIIKFCDQDVINITFKGKIKELDSIYNFMVTNTQEEPFKSNAFVIRHYNGSIKPWGHINNFERDFYLYFYYKNFSPFYSPIQIFNIYHKDMMIFQSEVNSPIQTGNENFTFKLLNDNSGDNIHKKNNNYAELTANYWVWKNYIPSHPNLKYIGFGHYRRFLDFNKSPCTDKVFCKPIPAIDFAYEFSEKYTQENIYPIISKYDIILPETYTIENKTVYQHFVDHHPVEELNNIIEVIESEYPEMLDDLHDYLDGKVSYFCLNYVMKVNLFNDFMTWAFNILNKLDKKTDWKKYTDYMSEKTPAYLMERFFNVWLKYKQRTENIKILNVHGVLLNFTESSNPDGIYKKVKIFPGISLVKKINKRILKIFGIKIVLKKHKNNELPYVTKILPGISLEKEDNKRILKIFGIKFTAKKIQI